MLIKDRKGYYKVGYMKNGNAIYVNADGKIGVEKNLFWLVEPTKEEERLLKGGCYVEKTIT